MRSQATRAHESKASRLYRIISFLFPLRDPRGLPDGSYRGVRRIPAPNAGESPRDEMSAGVPTARIVPPLFVVANTAARNSVRVNRPRERWKVTEGRSVNVPPTGPVEVGPHPIVAPTVPVRRIHAGRRMKHRARRARIRRGEHVAALPGRPGNRREHALHRLEGGRSVDTPIRISVGQLPRGYLRLDHV